MPANPLLSVHQQAGAQFQTYAQTEIVSTFGGFQLEYAAIRRSAAVMDLAHRGILQLTGKDRLEFLNNLLSNQLWDKAAKRGLSAGEGVYAFFLNVKGRIVADMNVLELGESTLLEMDARLVEPVRKALDRYLFAEQVKMSSQVGVLHEIAVHGPGAGEALGAVLEGPLAELGAMGSCGARVAASGAQVTVFRDDVCGVPGLVVIVPAEAAGDLWGQLAAKARPIGWAAFNTARIEAGRPIFGIDFDENTLPAETGQLGRAVSLTKGCYLGQEIVSRMHSRGQLARQVVGIRMNDDALPVAPVTVQDEQGAEIGQITSSTLSPMLSSRPVALGMLRRVSIAAGTVVRAAAEGGMHQGTVCELPFI